MCGILLMSLSPPSPSSSLNLDSAGVYLGCFPATNAVNDLVHQHDYDRHQQQHEQEGGFFLSGPWESKRKSSSDNSLPLSAVKSIGHEKRGGLFPLSHHHNSKTVNRTATSGQGCLDSDLQQFPSIEWCSEPEGEVEGDSNCFGFNLRAPSISAQVQNLGFNEKAPRRASLVRSISLVSNILNELCAMDNAKVAPVKKQTFASLENCVFKRRRLSEPSETSTCSTTARFMALTCPTQSQGLILSANRHDGTEKFFL